MPRTHKGRNPGLHPAGPEAGQRVQDYEPLIRAIAIKLTLDEDLREDCAQVARVELLGVREERIRGDPDRYCRNLIRNSMLDYLTSYNTGDWYTGRTVRRRGKKEVRQPRFLRIDLLPETVQIDRSGRVYPAGWQRAYGAHALSTREVRGRTFLRKRSEAPHAL